MSEGLVALLGLLLLAFVFGLNVGTWIADRLNRKRHSSEADLGRVFNNLIADTTDPLRFTGPGVTVTRQITATRNGVKCKVTFEAEQEA